VSHWIKIARSRLSKKNDLLENGKKVKISMQEVENDGVENGRVENGRVENDGQFSKKKKKKKKKKKAGAQCGRARRHVPKGVR